MRPLLLIILFFPLFSLAQNRNNIWCFGDSAGIDFNGSISLPISTALDTRGSCVSIANSSGQLLFYAETRAGITNNSGQIFNKLGQLMSNGDSILGQGWYNEMICIPHPGNDSSYYLFSIGVTTSSLPGLYYTEINFAFPDTLGAVTQKNIQLLNFKMVDCLTAVKHGNGRDWWIICRKSSFGTGTANNEWYMYLVTPSGIINYGVQYYGTLNHTNSGRLCFSKNGDKLCFVSLLGIVELFNFDRCTGILSDSVAIEGEQFGFASPYYWSCAYSPSGQYLYVTVNKIPSRLWQYDTWAANIAATKTLIWETYTPPYTAGAIKLAPDNKIYMSCAWVDSFGGTHYPYDSTMYYPENMNLGVINAPDSVGLTCNFQPWSFYLGGKRTYVGLPNNPDYELPRDSGSACDTLLWTSLPNPSQGGTLPTLQATYIQDWQKLFVNAQHLKGTTYTLTVTDITGRQVYVERGERRVAGGYFTMDLDCSSFSNGMYIVTLTTNKEQLSKKFVKN